MLEASPAREIKPEAQSITGAPRGDALLTVFLLLSLWVPSSERGYPAFLEPARYALYVLLAGGIIIRNGFNFSVAARSLSAVLMVVFFSYCALSAFWSDNLGSSIQKSIMLIATFSVAASTVSSRRAVDLKVSVSMALVIFVLLGVLAAVFLPSIGVENSWRHAGKWRGLSAQKNVFGLTAAIGAIFLVGSRNLVPKKAFNKIIWWSSLLICFLALLKSESRGAMVDLLVGFGAMVVLSLPSALIYPALILGGVILVGIMQFVLPIIQLDGSVVRLGDFNIDTANRVKIWSFGLSHLDGRELFGFGYGGFWTEAREEVFARANRWVLPNFHNGYISVLTETGFLGALLFLSYVGSVSVLIISNARKIIEKELIAEVSIIIVYMIHNVYENNLTRSTDIFLMIFMISCLMVCARFSGGAALRSAVPGRRVVSSMGGRA